MVWVSTTFSLEQKSGFKFERNKDLTFIVIIIDIDWYGKNNRDNSLGHIAQPYVLVNCVFFWLCVQIISMCFICVKNGFVCVCAVSLRAEMRKCFPANKRVLATYTKHLPVCHESGCHSPHILHHTTAAHHPWTAFPIHHCTNHTAVTNHSFALIVSPHLHLIHTHTYKQQTSMHTGRSLV